MAIAVTSDASAFKRTANLPAASTAYSIWGWFRLTTDRNTFTGLVGLANAVDGASFHQLGTDSDGTTLKIWSQTTSTNVAALSTNTWYFGAMTCSGTGAGTLIGYVRALTANALTSASIAGTSFTPGAAEWGRDCVTGEFISGEIHACGMSNAVLSADELLELSYFHEPQLDGIRSLNVFYPTIESVNTNATVDRSGNARNATATVGALVDAPALLWRSPSPNLVISGTTDITGTLDATLGVLTSAGAGSVDVSGSLSKTLGALTSVGAGSVDVSGQGAVTLGALVLSAAGSVSVEGSLAKTLGALTLVAAGDNGDVAPPDAANDSVILTRRRRPR